MRSAAFFLLALALFQSVCASPVVSRRGEVLQAKNAEMKSLLEKCQSYSYEELIYVQYYYSIPATTCCSQCSLPYVDKTIPFYFDSAQCSSITISTCSSQYGYTRTSSLFQLMSQIQLKQKELKEEQNLKNDGDHVV